MSSVSNMVNGKGVNIEYTVAISGAGDRIRIVLLNVVKESQLTKSLVTS